MSRRMAAKKLFVVPFLCTVLILGCMGLAGCDGSSSSNQNSTDSKATIKIGAVLDLTGPGSSLGVPEKDTIELWEAEINKKGGINGQQVDVVIVDNASDETKGVMAFKKLVEEEQVCAVIGASQSGTTIAMIKSATEAKIPLISCASSIKITNPIEERSWIFKTAQDDSVVAQRLCDYLKTQNVSKVAFLSVNTAYGDSGLTEFTAVAPTAGISIVAQEKFGDKDVDFTAQLTNAKNAQPDAMIIWAIPPSAALITKQAADLNIGLPVYHSHGIANKKFIEMAGDSANGVVFAAGKLMIAESLPDSDPQKAVILEYLKLYENGDRQRSSFSGHAYDAVLLLAQVIEKNGTDPAKIRDGLEAATMPGISGVFHMSATDHAGIDKTSQVIIKIENGEWKLIEL